MQMKLYEFIEQWYNIKLFPYQKVYIEKLANFSGDIEILPARGGNKTLVIGNKKVIAIPDSVLFPYLIFREMQQRLNKNCAVKEKSEND